jgi:hypothetical protein
MRGPVEICRGFTDDQWRALRNRLDGDDEPAWNCAVEVFSRRIRERFLSCVESLEDSDSHHRVPISSGAAPDCSTLPADVGGRIVVPGFAIMALCCLLVETLQSFREGQGSQKTKKIFKEFLKRPAFGREFVDDSVASSFAEGVRNGILHEAETRRWVIRRNEPAGRIVRELGHGRYLLNRVEFCRAVKAEFEGYAAELREPAKKDLRKKFLKQMDDVVRQV